MVECNVCGGSCTGLICDRCQLKYPDLHLETMKCLHCSQPSDDLRLRILFEPPTFDGIKYVICSKCSKISYCIMAVCWEDFIANGLCFKCKHLTYYQDYTPIMGICKYLYRCLNAFNRYTDVSKKVKDKKTNKISEYFEPSNEYLKDRQMYGLEIKVKKFLL